MALFIWKVFSLIAARSKQFTAYLMFAEDYIQRWLFISTKGFSRAGLIVLVFTVLHVLASLYGTLLWALDSPGYIFRSSDATVADYAKERNIDAPYIVQINLSPGDLQETNETLAKVIGAELFNPGLNYTLTPQTEMGTPEITTTNREDGYGARIWLDDEGFSVSADSYAPYPPTRGPGEEVFGRCIAFRPGLAAWNCTFNNTFAQGLLATVVGLPEVHWDDVSDAARDSRYISPNRVDNIWASFGAGGGSAVMMQIFTVTKGTRRHTFAESALRVSMLTTPEAPFAESDVKDLVQRSWSQDKSLQNDPTIDRIVNSMMSAQDEGMSFQFGATVQDNRNFSVLQSSWGYYTPRPSGRDLFSLISITSTNITLLRSETIDEAPTPFEKCDQRGFQNEAFGGKVTQTDCVGANSTEPPRFFGQVDTAAVLILTGLGDGRSPTSAASLNDEVLSWLWNATEAMAPLLVARGYAASVDPSLVHISVEKLIVAMSGLQLLLTCLALVLCLIAGLALIFFADAHWANSLLSNLIHSTSERVESAKPGYISQPPDVALRAEGGRTFMTSEGKYIVLYDPTEVPMQTQAYDHNAQAYEHNPQADDQNAPKEYMGTETRPVAPYDPGAVTQGLLSTNPRGNPNFY